SAITALASRTDTPTLIYVTHHTEEILPLFSHILLLRRGQVVQAGERESVMNADILSAFFENRVAVENHDNRIYLRPHS
ncbi:molybdenum ABC transporter ATP-binding protein, partial [Paenibacillus sepulcri]|nr:molybdenum ABC transporter ATP-binding protein [Paenibacillus sepulcri]